MRTPEYVGREAASNGNHASNGVALDDWMPRERRPFPTAHFMHGDAPRPPALLVNDLVLDRDVNLWVSHGGSGKSTALLTNAVCVAIGQRVFSTLEVKRSGLGPPQLTVFAYRAEWNGSNMPPPKDRELRLTFKPEQTSGRRAHGVAHRVRGTTA